MTEADLEKGRASPGDSPGKTKEEGEQRASTSSTYSHLPVGASQLDSKEKGEEQVPTDSEEAQTAEESQLGQEEPDRFDVGWDGGDDDPLCPRSMPLGKKWLMVFITCFGSLCVYVPRSLPSSERPNSLAIVPN